MISRYLSFAFVAAGLILSQVSIKASVNKPVVPWGSRLFWQNANGTVAAWNLRGGNVQSATRLLDGKKLPSGWKVKATGDFNSDGQTDLLVQRGAGQTALWLMNSNSVATVVSLNNGKAVTPGWRIAGVGDLDGDSKTDIVWQHNNGHISVWLMDGTNFVGSQFLNQGQAVPKGCRLAAVGDLVGDSSNDLIFVNPSGRLVVWCMNSTNFVSSQLINTGHRLPANWRVVSVGDFNGDGQKDLLVQNKNGQQAFWFLSPASPATVSSSRLIRDGKAAERGSVLVGAEETFVSASAASDQASSNSIEGQLLAAGKEWTRVDGEITVGSYVEDILIGRLNQPEGRGSIAIVVELTSEDGRPVAIVDFGLGYTVGIYLSELCLLDVHDATTPVGLSVEEQLIAAGKQWTRIDGEITVGSYVEDILVGRLNQPEGRGSIAIVLALASDGERQAAIVDFGRGLTVGIYLDELSLLQISDAVTPAPTGLSIEQQLTAAGKQWTRTNGVITVGSYVEDILVGRLNQPEGRGSIGVVLSLTNDNDRAVAIVDFGRDFSVGIFLTELSLVNISDVVAPTELSVEEQLIAAGKQWTRTNGEIQVGSYVEDILVGRLNQPAGRGSVAIVLWLATDGSRPAAMLDFGRGFTVGIYLDELALLNISDAGTPTGLSVEEQLIADGKQWTRIGGEITVGSYVEDILENRLNQPEGRGSVGIVISVSTNGQPAAVVDFGRGFSVGIFLTELSLLQISDVVQPVGLSVEEQLIADGKQWTRVGGNITVGAYVEDILVGRLNQPDGRGSIGKVVSLGTDNGQAYAMVDFGRGYTVGIFLTELSLLEISDVGQPAELSIEEQLIADGKTWTRVSGEITVGSYVEDILVGRLNQPAGRGSIGKVVSLGMDNDRAYAMVDFGRGYTIGIYLTELSLLLVQ